jgi:AcrR family transcriptional regulator
MDTVRRGRRTGRPARISRQQIAEAALEVGLSDLTLKAVADHLGVTVAALYHHVDSKDDLVRLAADRSADRLTLPADHGQHWAVWLLEWGVYNRASMVADPALFEQFLDGAISPEVIARGAEGAIAVLVRRGFEPTDAQEAFERISAVAIGLAVASIRDHRSAARGEPRPTDAIRAAARHDPEAMPVLASLAEPGGAEDTEERHLGHLRAVVIGLAVLRGEDPAETARLLEGSAP